MAKQITKNSKTGNFAISRKGVANINLVEGMVMRSTISGRYTKIVDSHKSIADKVEMLKKEFGLKKKK